MARTKFNPRAPQHANEYVQIKDLTGRQIIAYVKELTGELITISPKNKLGIIKEAILILKKPIPVRVPSEAKVLDLDGRSKKELIELVSRRFAIPIGGWFNLGWLSSKEEILNRAKEAFETHNYIVKGTEVWRSI